jgi:excinuclease ABC subunit C
MNAALRKRIRQLPDRSGIYVFKDAAGAVLYVGKAKSLRKRVVHYMAGDQEPRLAAMVTDATDLEFVVTDSEAEALLLENNWIKQKRPRYNILLRDDKTYPYLKLTGEEYPRIAFTRRIRDDGAQYFGPFLPGGLARKGIKLIQKLFQIRVCTIPIDGSLPRPCLYHDMRRCLGPCVDGLTSLEEYRGAAEATRLFLAGRNEELVKDLRRSMNEAAEKLEYEQAARLRDRAAEIEAIGQRRKLSSVQGEHVDIFGCVVRGGQAAVVILVMRGGQVLDRRELFWEESAALDAATLLDELLPQIYDRTSFIPKELHLPLPIEGQEALAEWLGERKGERVYVRLPSRGPKAERVALANRNAELAYRRRFRSGSKVAAALASLRQALELPEEPRRVEGFDISNFQGDQPVASLVVWEEGRMRKGDYRSFNIRKLTRPDDFAAMRQAVERRYRRVLEEVGTMPDLILVDGGRGQLNAALEALAILGVDETPVAGLAKREEEIYLPWRPEPLRLERSDPGLQLLQEVRDEAHRFAVSRHRRRRSKRTLGSRLDEIPGIGPRRRRQLLRRFGSLAGVGEASLAEIQAEVGTELGLRVFERVRQWAEESARID